MDRKSIIGLILIFLVFMGYMWWTAPTEEELAAQRAMRDSIMRAEQMRIDSLERAQNLSLAQENTLESQLQSDNDSVRSAALAMAKNELGVFSNNLEGDSVTISVNTSTLNLEFSSLGARVKSAILSDYRTYDSLPLQLLSPNEQLNLVFLAQGNKLINTEKFVFKTFCNNVQLTDDATLNVEKDSLVISMRAYTDDSTGYNENQYLEFRYIVYPENYLVDFDIVFHGLNDVIQVQPYVDLYWNNQLIRQEKNKENERRTSSIYYKPVSDDVDYITEGRDEVEKQNTPLQWISFKQQYFCNVLIADKEFSNADLETRTNVRDTNSHYLCDMSAVIGLPYESVADYTVGMKFYFGPNKYRELADIGMQLDRQIPLGWGFFLLQWINRFVIIPVFNFLESFNWNYGFIILVLTLLVKLVLFPIAFKSYRSSAVMRVLQPEINEINAKYPKQEDAMKKQQAVMALYKKAGVSPMSGCLPMLLQFPILIAMFRFFPACIELRQQGFWWVDDLSSYDSVLNFGFNIPLYGDHISLWCLLMAAVNLWYTHITMKQQAATNTMPGMKFMMYAMPIFMLFALNSYSSGLNYYYFLSMCITIIQMWAIRKFTDEDKIREKIRLATISAKNKPVKKSKFMQRLEEMQRMNEELERQRANNKNNRKR
ncbi:MAG: membrane protein insertase YidC [Bacteroidales bacterium]|nr:membrane protein insertase YidC [Bacteroidales bacterium]